MSLRILFGARAIPAWAGGLALAAALLAPGCIVDDDHRCDPNQVLEPGTGLTGDTCVCVANAVPDEARGYGCLLCGDNETAANGSCECVLGFARGSDGACAEVSIGSLCES